MISCLSFGQAQVLGGRYGQPQVKMELTIRAFRRRTYVWILGFWITGCTESIDNSLASCASDGGAVHAQLHSFSTLDSGPDLSKTGPVKLVLGSTGIGVTVAGWLEFTDPLGCIGSDTVAFEWSLKTQNGDARRGVFALPRKCWSDTGHGCIHKFRIKMVGFSIVPPIDGVITYKLYSGYYATTTDFDGQVTVVSLRHLHDLTRPESVSVSLVEPPDQR